MTLGINGVQAYCGCAPERSHRTLAHYYENGVAAHFANGAASASRRSHAARVAPMRFDCWRNNVISRTGGAAFFLRRERPSCGTLELLRQLRNLRGIDRPQRGAGEAGGAGDVAVMHGALHLR